MKKAYIFDLDGTLLETTTSLVYTVNRTMNRLGLKEINDRQCRKFIGYGARKLIESSVLNSREKCDELYLDQALAIYLEEFDTYCTYQVEPYEGIVDMLSYLKENGCKLAVLSNKPHAHTQKVVSTVFGEGFFDYVQGHAKEFPKKPDPTSMYYVMEQLQVEKEECVYVGDSEVDMRTGKNAGVTTIGVSWGFRKREVLEAELPTAVLNQVREILTIE